jgi:3-methyladenine DNA glycosylase AlkD
MTNTQLQAELEKLANPDLAIFAQRFFRTAPGEYGYGDKFRGIRVPEIKKLVSKHAVLPFGETKNLLRSEFHEDRLLALMILVRQFAKGDELVRTRIYELYLKNMDAVNNWDLVDSSAPYIVGPHLLDKDRQPLHRLARSINLWQRRIAIIATSHFIRNNDFADTLAISEVLLVDREDLIHKAVGWMLREVGKRDLEIELAFLEKHAGKMPRTMLRYAIEKFPESQRKDWLVSSREKKQWVNS